MPDRDALLDFLANAQITGTPFLPFTVLGGICVVLGLLFRLGLIRGYWPGMYRNQDLPFYQRNAPFAAIPYGLGLISAATAA